MHFHLFLLVQSKQHCSIGYKSQFHCCHGVTGSGHGLGLCRGVKYNALNASMFS